MVDERGVVVLFPSRPEPREPADFESAVLSALRVLTEMLAEDVEVDRRRSELLAELAARVEALEKGG